MNYLLKNRRRDSGTRKPIIKTLVILAIAGALYFLMPKFVSQTLYGIARPVWGVRDYVGGGMASLWSALADKKRLANENLVLKAKLDEAGVALLDLDTYKKENSDLKKLLGRSETESRILASVLAKPNQSIYDTLVIDAGENLGVKVGDEILFEDFIIGEISEVLGSYSKVVLASSPGQIHTVRIGNSGIDTQAEGRGAGNFIAKLPKEIDIQNGDLVKSRGISPRFFGVVGDIEQTEPGQFKFILFKSPINVNTIEWVEVVRTTKISNF